MGSQSPITVAEARTPAELSQAFSIRVEVFVHEQGVGAAVEIDAHEGEARHLLAWRGGRAVGTLRVRFLEGGRSAKVERVAVLAEARGLAVGRALLAAALELAAAAGASSARLHAQTRAVGFYLQFGFETTGAPFMEDGIPHVAMTLALPMIPVEGGLAP